MADWQCPRCKRYFNESDVYYFECVILHKSGICTWNTIGVTNVRVADHYAFRWVREYLSTIDLPQIDAEDLKAFLFRKRVENDEK